MLGFNEEETKEVETPPETEKEESLPEGTAQAIVDAKAQNKDFEEAKAPKMTGKKKFEKLCKQPFAVGMETFTEKTFEIDLTLLGKQNKRLLNQVKRAIELKMIKAL